MPSAYFYLCVLCVRDSMTRIGIKESLEHWARGGRRRKIRGNSIETIELDRRLKNRWIGLQQQR